MRLLVSFLLWFVWSIVVHGQSKIPISVEIKPEFRIKERSIPIDVVAVDEDSYFMHYSRGKFGHGSDFLIRFDNDFHPTADITELSPPGEMNDTISTVGFLQRKSSLLHLSVSGTVNARRYYKRVFDLDTRKLREPELIAEVKSDERKASRAYEALLTSNDTSHVAFIYTIPNRNKDLQKLKVYRMNRDFNTLSEEVYEFPYSNKTFSFWQIRLSNHGQLDILAKVYDTEAVAFETKNKGYKYILFQIRESVEQKAEIRFPGKHVRDLSMDVSKDGEYYFTGLYSERDLYAVRGYVFKKLGRDGEHISQKVVPLSQEYFTQLVKPGKKRDKIIKKLASERFEEGLQVYGGTVFNEDKNLFVLLAEKKWTVSSNYTVTYNAQEISLIAINSDGDLEWFKKIGKNNSKSNVPIYSGYRLIRRDNYLMFIYGDHIENQNHVYGRMPNAFVMDGMDYCIAATTVDWSGNMRRSIVAKIEEVERTRIRPGLSRWIDDDSILFFGQDISNLKNQRFIKINYLN